MRDIGTLPDESQARRLADYLFVQGTTTKLEARQDGWAVWVREEEQVGPAIEELKRFREQPNDPCYAAAAGEAERMRRESARREATYRRNFVNVRDRWSAPAGPLRVTWLLIAACVFVAVMSNFGRVRDPDDRVFLDKLFISSYRSPRSPALPEVRSGEVWRLVTPIFIHFGIVHLAFNMMWLHSLGRVIEGRQGSLRFGLLVLATAVAPNLAQYWWDGQNFGGMSGVVFGLFGYVWMRGRTDARFGRFLSPDTVALMLIWLVLCMTGLVGRVADAAHLMGLVVGVVIGLVTSILMKPKAE